MRFGQNFHSYTIPEWDGLYIHYDKLKELLKAPLAVDDGAPVSAGNIKESLIDAFSRLHSSEKALYLSMTQRHDLIFSYHLETQPEPAPVNGSLLRTSFNPEVVRYAQEAIIDLQSNLNKLQWFDRVNHEAVGHVLAKLDKSHSHRGVNLDAVMSEWHQMQQTIDTARAEGRKLLRDAMNCFQISKEKSAIFPSATRDTALVGAIAHGSSKALEKYLDENEDLKPDIHRSLFKGFAMRHSWQCLMILASRFASSIDNHCLTVLFCNLRATSEQPRAASLSERQTDDFQPVSRVLRKLFDAEREIATHMLCRIDVAGHSPLHYAMKSSFDIFTTIPNSLDEDTSRAFLLESMLSEDGQGLTPLHLATIEGHTSIITNFFDILSLDLQRNKPHKFNVVAAACLNLAMKSGNDRLVKELSGWADTQNMSAQGQSAFHIAARTGRCGYMKVLINANAPESLNLNIVDSRGRTPLIDASVRGHISVVEVLLEAGADPSLVDNSGWTARKYAVYCGHLTTAELFPEPGNSPARQSRGSTTSPPASTSLTTALAFSGDSQKHSLVVYLGSMQLTNDQPPVQLAGTSSHEMPSVRQAPQLYHLEISVGHRNKQFQTVNLPLLHDPSSKPLVFKLEGENEPQLLIRVFKDDTTDEFGPSLVAAGVVSLHSTRVFCGHQRESLIREHAVILLSKDSQEPIGTVLITCVTARSFGYLQNRVPTVTSALHKSGQMTLVGHRGFGQNVASRHQLQLGENTIGSFMTAADHGATFVEFDAQVTRDLETVIYHDLSLSETGTDIPIHDLTIDQYKYASSVQTPQGSPLIAPDEQTIIGQSAAVRRSRSFVGQKDVGAILIRDRLKHTVDFKSKAMKPNIRGDVIQEPLVTLPELLQRLPPALGLNIEIKYPRLHEAIEAGVAPIALEINLFVDTILKQVDRYADQRPIILSSFTPEVCILLSMKQKAYPVLFISNAGKLPANDLERRVASVQAGVHFAKTWGLAGLCLASEPLMLYPELIGDIKRSGLLCASYGPQNSIPENVLIQRDSGLDMIMVDKVALIAKTLRI